MNFQTQIKGSDVELYNLDHLSKALAANAVEGGTYEIENADVTICWTVEIEAREWGIKSVHAFITDIKGSFDLALFDEEGEENGISSWNLPSFPKFQTNLIVSFDEWNQLQITNIEIDFSDMTVEVS